MDRKVKIYVTVLVLLFAGFLYIDSTKPKPINWTPTYSTKDKIPFGLYVLEEEIKVMFKDNGIEKINITPYEYFEDSTKVYVDENNDDEYSDNYDEEYDDNDLLVDSTAVAENTVAESVATEIIDSAALQPHKNINFLSITEFNTIDDTSVAALCRFVIKGNTVFMSAKSFPQSLQDSLKILMDNESDHSNGIMQWVVNKKLGTKKYNIIEGNGKNYFSKIDTLNTTVLGYQSQNKDSVRVNFIKVKYGNGSFILHSQPAAFTNIHMLKKDHYEYVEKVLSYIPKGKFLISTAAENDENITKSKMDFWLNQPAFKWGWRLLLFAFLLFILFNAKRKQRIVPIIKPLANTTLDFTKTIGNLYFLEGDHDNIINKKIIYFLEKIRNDYLVDTSKLDEDFVSKLHQKSGKKITDIKKVVFLINTYRRSPHTSIEEDLIQINNAIENILH
jgi:hypothetical protein